MKKRIQAELEIEIPPEWNEKLMVELLANYLKLNRFVDVVVHVTAYPMNYKLMTQYLEMPVERVQ